MPGSNDPLTPSDELKDSLDGSWTHHASPGNSIFEDCIYAVLVHGTYPVHIEHAAHVISSNPRKVARKPFI